MVLSFERMQTMFINREERNELLLDLVVPDKDATSDPHYSQVVKFLVSKTKIIVLLKIYTYAYVMHFENTQNVYVLSKFVSSCTSYNL